MMTRRTRRFGFPVVSLALALCSFRPVGAAPEAAPLVPAASAASSPADTDPTAEPPLPPVFQPSPIPLGHGVLVGGALDLRTRDANSGRTGGVWVNAAELDFQHAITKKNDPKGKIVLQLIAEDPPDRHDSRDIQVGEAYLLYRIPLHTDTGTTAFLKLGQFQIPFALLAVYDPHLSVIQPLYSQSLGLRTDWGVALTGTFYGYLQYDFALTTGTGPNHADVDPNRLITFRLGRTFITRNGVVTVGGSLLSGRLPVTDLDSLHPFANELPPSGRVRLDHRDSIGDTFTPKTRIAGDVTYTYKRATVRGEAMSGADRDSRVQGYYAEGAYGFTPRLSALAAHSLWIYPVGNSSSTRTSGGLSYALGPRLSLSAVYEYLRDAPRDADSQVRHRLTLQALLRF